MSKTMKTSSNHLLNRLQVCHEREHHKEELELKNVTDIKTSKTTLKFSRDKSKVKVKIRIRIIKYVITVKFIKSISS